LTRHFLQIRPGRALSNIFSAGNRTFYGYFDHGNDEIVLDLKKDKSRLMPKAPRLDDRKLDGFVHAHEIFHLLLKNKGLKFQWKMEEKFSPVLFLLYLRAKRA
jgi:hypothetical protein